MTGNAKLDNILLGICAFFTFASMGLIGYAHFGIKKDPINELAEINALTEGAKLSSQVEIIKMKKLTINLYSRKTRLRFLDIQINVLPFENRQSSQILQYEPIIADTVITIAGDMEPDELNSVSGKIVLEDRIKRTINRIAKNPLIKKIYFSRFVIQ